MIAGPEGRGPLSLQGLRLGVLPNAFVAPVDAEVRTAWQAAMLVLKEEGAEVVDIDVQRPTLDTYRTIQMPEASLAHMQKGWLTEHGADYGEVTRSRLLAGQRIAAVDYLQAQQARRIFSSSLRAAMHPVDALVLPTIPMPAITIAQIDQDIRIDGVTENATAALLRLTMPFNLAGLPAISFPCGFSTAGTPIGLQVVGKPFEESIILRIAHAYQQLTDWHTQNAQPERS